MQAANDNLPEDVDGLGDWELLYEVAKKVVEACSDSTALHQLDRSCEGGASATGSANCVPDNGGDHARRSGRDSVGSTAFRRAT